MDRLSIKQFKDHSFSILCEINWYIPFLVEIESESIISEHFYWNYRNNENLFEVTINNNKLSRLSLPLFNGIITKDDDGHNFIKTDKIPIFNRILSTKNYYDFAGDIQIKYNAKNIEVVMFDDADKYYLVKDKLTISVNKESQISSFGITNLDDYEKDIWAGFLHQYYKKEGSFPYKDATIKRLKEMGYSSNVN